MTARLDGGPRADKGTHRKYGSPEEKKVARKEQRRQASARWKAKNIEKLKAQGAEYRKANSALCAARSLDWQKKNPEKVRAAYFRRTYGITLAAYAEMEFSQGSACAICRQTGSLVIDHCHASGAVRGLLCDRCNVGLGCMQDDIERLKAAVQYLEGIAR